MDDKELLKKFLYGVRQNEDGTEFVLTVFEDGRSCSVVLSKEMAARVAELLTGRAQ